MFSSLASFIFGSNTPATTNCESTNHQPTTTTGQRVESPPIRNPLERLDPDAENIINVTSSTPSVTGSCHRHPPNDSISSSIWEKETASNSQGGGKRNKGKRNKSNRAAKQQQRDQKSSATSLAKLLTPNESCDEDLDEEDWFIVEKEDEDEYLPRTDSEEEISVAEVKSNSKSNSVGGGATSSSSVQPLTAIAAVQSDQRHHHYRQHINNSHSIYSGPRPQQQRNLVQRARYNSRSSSVSLNVSTLIPPRSIIDVGINAGIAGHGNGQTNAVADIECITQSLYVARPHVVSSSTTSLPLQINGGNEAAGMEESWFVTPPPCFTSLGPVNMETSPYENLLIEHPSMSVYHSIRSAQEAAESFVHLDLGVGESRQTRRPTAIAAVSATDAVEAANNNGRNAEAAVQQPRNGTARNPDRFTAAQLKQELFTRSTQKCQEKKERQNLCRGAIKRSNKVRDFQSKANRQRRSDMQHCKILSGANNNRKCCF